MFNIKEFFKLTYYTSELDQFLADYDKNHPRFSASRRQEIEKHRRVAALRDKPAAAQTDETLWDKF